MTQWKVRISHRLVSTSLRIASGNPNISKLLWKPWAFMNLSALGYCTQDTRQEKASQDAVPRPHKSVMFCHVLCFGVYRTNWFYRFFLGPRRMRCICSFRSSCWLYNSTAIYSTTSSGIAEKLKPAEDVCLWGWQVSGCQKRAILSTLCCRHVQDGHLRQSKQKVKSLLLVVCEIWWKKTGVVKTH